VSYSGQLYKANFANPGYVPTISTYYWSAYASNWAQGKQYAVGSMVSYSGKLYVAKFANPGYIPTVSTYYWSKQAC
jgi:chitinase